MWFAILIYFKKRGIKMKDVDEKDLKQVSGGVDGDNWLRCENCDRLFRSPYRGAWMTRHIYCPECQEKMRNQGTNN